jgi:hypothetical protein
VRQLTKLEAKGVILPGIFTFSAQGNAEQKIASSNSASSEINQSPVQNFSENYAISIG